MDPVKTKYLKALKVPEIADYLQGLEDSSDEDFTNVELAILPSDEVDEMTDTEEGPDDDMGVLPVSDVAGQVEFSCTMNNVEEDRPNQFASRTSKTIAWRKCNPVYFDLQSQSNSDKQCFDNMIMELEGKSAVEIFEKLLYDEILKYIVHETVTYDKNYKNDLNFNLTVELKVFIGILFFSSYHHLPQSKLYWCRDDDIHVPFVEKAMSRNRFDKIKSYLHFSDNSRIDSNDKAFKIRPFIDKDNDNLAVDKMIVKYFGHHGIKQFIKGKPVRFGYKLWALCGVSGYCYNFSLYTGKDAQSSNSSGDSLGSRVVKKLLEVCTDPSAHVVYFDNFFSNMQLMIDLKYK